MTRKMPFKKNRSQIRLKTRNESSENEYNEQSHGDNIVEDHEEIGPSTINETPQK